MITGDGCGLLSVFCWLVPELELHLSRTTLGRAHPVLETYISRVSVHDVTRWLAVTSQGVFLGVCMSATAVASWRARL